MALLPVNAMRPATKYGMVSTSLSSLEKTMYKIEIIKDILPKIEISLILESVPVLEQDNNSFNVFIV